MASKETIRKYALQNALKFGKAQAGSIIGKLFAEDPSLKEKAKELMKDINKVISEVNTLSEDEIKNELSEVAPEMLEKKKKEKHMAELPNAVMGKVVTRIPPEPSKYTHIGHGLSFLLNYIYAKKYDGKCILRFEDTNPTACSQEYVDAMLFDIQDYLAIKPDKIVYVSDDMDTMYKYAVSLVEHGQAYVCFCAREVMQDNRHKGKECKCRAKSKAENMKAWKDMLAKKYEEGACSLRLKLDMEAENQVLRDPVMFRISLDKHYRHGDKYIVWPMYDFENAVEDDLCSVTHILRSNEFGDMRVELQEKLKEMLGLKKQTMVQYGRFTIIGAVAQGREIRKLIEEGKVSGWDDPSLVTLKALRRRGFVKEALYTLAEDVGLSPSPTNIDWKTLAAFNRKIIDPLAHRYFFIRDLKEIKVEKAPSQEIELDLHPDNKKGGRKFSVKDNFYISEKDFEQFKDGKLYRLMDCLNFVYKKGKFIFDSLEYENYKKDGDKIIHWLPKEKLVSVEIRMPDNQVFEGLGENALKDAKIDEVVQLARFGFCRLDAKKKDKLTFWFTHE